MICASYSVYRVCCPGCELEQWIVELSSVRVDTCSACGMKFHSNADKDSGELWTWTANVARGRVWHERANEFSDFVMMPLGAT